MKFLGPFNLKELYQIMVILWVFTPCGKGFADVSEEPTVSVFRVTALDVCYSNLGGVCSYVRRIEDIFANQSYGAGRRRWRRLL